MAAKAKAKKPAAKTARAKTKTKTTAKAKTPVFDWRAKQAERDAKRAEREKHEPDQQLQRRVREIMDAKEYLRPRDPNAEHWTISSLLAQPYPLEEVARAVGRQLGAWHRVSFAMKLWASLPEVPQALDSLRRSLSSKDEDRKRMAVATVGWGGRVDLAAELVPTIEAAKKDDWTCDFAIGSAGKLAAPECLPALLALAAKPAKLEHSGVWSGYRSVLRALLDYESAEAVPFFRRYFPRPAAGAKVKPDDVAYVTGLAAHGLARMGDAEAIAWLGKRLEDEDHGVGALCDALGWGTSDDRADNGPIAVRWAAHEAGQKTTCPYPPRKREPEPPVEGTIADLEGPVAKKPDDRLARHRRGNLCFDAGLWSRAMHDYTTVVDLEERVNDTVVMRAWLTRTKLHLKSYADLELRRWLRTNGERLDPQRHRLTRHVAGLCGIDEATEGAETPEDRIEAWFFAGARALFLGDEETGRRALERCLSAVTKSPSAEQVSARALLERAR